MVREALVVRKSEGTPGEGVDWTFKVSGKDTDGLFDFMVGPLRYHNGPPLHIHREMYDSFYVLSGVLTVQLGDEVVDLEPGDFVTIPPGVPHTFDNMHSPEAPVMVINFMTPGGLDEAFSDLAAATSEPIEQRRAVATRHGITTVGPPLWERNEDGPAEPSIDA